MRHLAPLLVLLLLPGCATSAAGLHLMGVEHVINSQRPAQEFATCAAEVMQGSPTLRGSGGHWWVLRDNGVGVPIVRWDFTDKPGGGSVAELRATAIAGAAKDKVRRCANG
jgi:hypothetical protein